MSDRAGRVYLVGAGPGNISYLTIRAQEILIRAEVLVYDALVDGKLLQLVPLNCRLFDVGKRGGRPSAKQAEIDLLLVEQCLQGKQVVRLKSGDPFIFGRSTSEIQALIAAGCDFEVVPGISSALAAPLLAGIPLTDPVLSRCFAVCSAHEPDELNWQTLSQIETLVILMGGRRLGEIAEQLQRHGRSPKTPIAVIRWAGHPEQQIWTGELGNILQLTAGISLSPAVIAIGEVVGLRPYLQNTSSGEKLEDNFQLGISISPTKSDSNVTNHQDIPLPLSGQTILITRAAGQSSLFCELLAQQGAKVIETPALEIGPPSSWEALDKAIANLHTFNWLILTSTNGVDYFFDRLQIQGKDARALSGLKIAVVGKKTAESLQQHGVNPDFIPPNFVADSLVENFPEFLEKQKILFPRVETGGREVLVQELTAKGAEVVEVPAYQSQCPVAIDPEALAALQQQTVDIITFASSKTVQNFYQLLCKHLPIESIQAVCLASIGPQTSQTCQKLFGRVDVEAQEYTLQGLTYAIVNWATKNRILA